MNYLISLLDFTAQIALMYIVPTLQYVVIYIYCIYSILLTCENIIRYFIFGSACCFPIVEVFSFSNSFVYECLNFEIL